MLDFMSACLACLPLPPSFLRRTSTASSRLQCSPPGPNSNLWIKVFPADLHSKFRIKVFPAGLHRKLWIRVFPARPPPQAPDQSVPCTPPPQAPDQSVPRASTAGSGEECSPRDLNHKQCPKIYQICGVPERMSEDMSDTYARKTLLQVKQCCESCNGICS